MLGPSTVMWKLNHLLTSSRREPLRRRHVHHSVARPVRRRQLHNSVGEPLRRRQLHRSRCSEAIAEAARKYAGEQENHLWWEGELHRMGSKLGDHRCWSQAENDVGQEGRRYSESKYARNCGSGSGLASSGLQLDEQDTGTNVSRHLKRTGQCFRQWIRQHGRIEEMMIKMFN